MQNYNVPILFLVFNRPECTAKVFEKIRKIKPARLFVAADGPRPNRAGEMVLCNQTRDIIEAVDWECEIHKLYSDENKGCKSAVSGALKWFFNQVEYGVVLEDDCVPDESFFPFCEELLIRYKDDERVGMICGRNDFDSLDIRESYSFSTSGSIWGWASWKRVLRNYDENAQDLLVDFHRYMYDATMDKFEKNRLFHQLKWTLDGSLNTWDYQLHVLLKFNSMFYIVPKNNLIENVGFGVNATHTTAIEEARAFVPVKAISGPITHPKWVIPNRKLSRKIVRADSNNFLIWCYILLKERLKALKKSNI